MALSEILPEEFKEAALKLDSDKLTEDQKLGVSVFVSKDLYPQLNEIFEALSEEQKSSTRYKVFCEIMVATTLSTVKETLDIKNNIISGNEVLNENIVDDIIDSSSGQSTGEKYMSNLAMKYVYERESLTFFEKIQSQFLYNTSKSFQSEVEDFELLKKEEED